jgi:hypothetical protein
MVIIPRLCQAGDRRIRSHAAVDSKPLAQVINIASLTQAAMLLGFKDEKKEEK